MRLSLITRIYVPLRSNEYELFFGPYENVIQEVCDLSGKIYVTFKSLNQAPLKIERIIDLKKEKIPVREKRRLKGSEYILKFSTVVTGSSASKLLSNSTPYFTESYVTLLLIYLNIAKPGAFNSTEGFVKVTMGFDEESGQDQPIVYESKFPMLLNHIAFHLPLLNKYKWPPLQEFKIIDVLTWLRGHWKCFEQVSNNKIQRALNAFSFLFNDNVNDNSSTELFFSLIGIEALFGNGKTEIQSQINIKSQILLGNRTDFKKKFNELYSFRSAFIHGSSNIINKYRVDDMSDEVTEREEKVFDQSGFAILLLLSSIQKHFELNKDEIEFEYILKP